ncbi:MAG: hypothetical protein AAB217_10905, partial [Chloroflexota bacterium]
MRQNLVSRRQVKQFAVFIHRFVSMLSILALMLPPMPVAAQGADTPTPDPSGTVLPTDAAPTVVATSDIPTETAIATETPPAVDTATVTAVPTDTPPATATPASATFTQESSVQFYFTVSPEQAAPGSDVIFTVVIANSGKTALTNAAFADTLPGDLAESKLGFGELVFDPLTRLLTWSAKEILPGATVTLQYTVTVSAEARPPLYLTDSALLTATELAEPVKGLASLLVSSLDRQLSDVAVTGDKANGLGNRVEIDVPPGALAEGGRHAIEVKDMLAVYPAKEGDIWTAFEIQLLADPAVVNATAESLAASELAELSGVIAESDESISLQPVAAEFKQPVELTVSFNGLADLSTLDSAYEPYLVTLDEASGVWVRVPIEIDRAANTITTETAHFSTWGAGIGASFPQNGAGVLLFDSAKPELFTGRSHFSIPIWSPPGRSGMAPSLALSYTSGMADGVLLLV